MIKAIIFDMDGVLIDSTKKVWEIHNMLLAKFNKYVPTHEISNYLGRSLTDQIALFEKNFGIVFDKEVYKLNFLAERKKELSEIKKSAKLVQLMKNIKSMNLKLAVATSSTKKRAEGILHKLGIFSFFDKIITSEDVKLGKPDPEIYLTTALKLEISPKDCLVVEDACSGIAAGKNAKMFVIGLRTPFEKETELEKANKTIDSLDELPKIVTELNSHLT